MADSILSLLFGPDGLSPPEWLRLAFAGGSRSRPSCRICGSYGHRHKDCKSGTVIEGGVTSGLRSGHGKGSWDTGSRKPDGEHHGGRGYRGRGGGRGGNRWGYRPGGQSGGRPGQSGGGPRPQNRNDHNQNISEVADMMENLAICTETSGENAALSKRIIAFEGKEWPFPIRREYNSTGTPLPVITNYYELSIGLETKIARYDFEIDGRNRSKEMIDAFIRIAFPTDVEYLCPDYARYLYTPGDWAPQQQEYSYAPNASNELAGHKFTIKSKLTLNIDGYRDYIAASDALISSALPGSNESTENSVIPVEFQGVLMALNSIILRNPRLKNRDLIHAKGNTLYNPASKQNFRQNLSSVNGLDIGHAAYILTGLHASVRPGSQRCLVNASKATNIFYRNEKLVECFNLRPGAPGSINVLDGPLQARDITSCNQFLRGVLLRVDLPDGSSQFRVFSGVSDKNAHQATWGNNNAGTQVTYSTYSAQVGRPLRIPNMQLFSFRSQSGSTRSEFPIEWCTIAKGQRYKLRLNGAATVTMIQKSCVDPLVYMANLGEEFSKVFRAEDETGNRTLNHYGLSVGDGLLKVDARKLEMPNVRLGNKITATIRPHDGSWSNRDVRFHRPVAIPSHIVLQILVDNSPQVGVQNGVSPSCRQAVTDLLGVCQQYGMNVTAGSLLGSMTLHLQLSDPSGAHDSIISFFRDKIAKLKTQHGGVPLVFCYLPSNDPRYYNAVKRGGDVFAGVLTVCMDGSKLEAQSNKRAYNLTLALKVNLKCGGINHTTEEDSKLLNIFPELKQNGVMLLGADVSHSGKRDLPSIAAVVGSYEPSHSRLNAEISLQTNKEMIERMGESVETHLKYFHTKNNRLPSSIVMFRDGVSESQYRQVLEKEVVAIDNAINQICYQLKVGDDKRPKLTVLVVGKRHHTRFFPIPSRVQGLDDKTPPGLVVDRAVTAIYEKDFFLQAHGAIKGTPRPAHYFVIRDDLKLGDAAIQQMAFVWSFSFGRSFRSISYAPPAYCADIACGRARAWFQHEVEKIRGQPVASGSGAGTDLATVADANLRTVSAAGTLHADLVDKMWYI
ncbi:hypothetical protein TWF481_011729 [Arthrobotrys musiformis]|uniref:Uncharacterized protein n=1 Tax=Arthrobotrys musiformis TaxID=47236 RepID=A0AAV9W1A2_9PEZI